MKLLIATDAWRPQINGVVRSYENLIAYCGSNGVTVDVLAPGMFRNYPCPTYPEIRLAAVSQKQVSDYVARTRPDHIHIATEGPIGLRTRSHCLTNQTRFTTSYHTRFPEYVAARFYAPLTWTYAFERWFHNASNGTMVATNSLADELKTRGFKHIMPWTRGVDTQLYRPRDLRDFGTAHPVLLYVGRVAIEKNITAFLDLDVPGRKVVVGGGPQLASLQARYKDVTFTGPLVGEQLARAYASADCFVFPSRTDTFGIVLLEAISSGLPVAAFPVTGPTDVITEGVNGALDENLAAAIGKALALDRSRCRASAAQFSWEKSASMFLENVESVLRSEKTAA